MTRPALAVLLILLAVAVVPGLADAQQERPNIVFLFSDDHAAHALSAYREHLQYGARLPETPTLDRLAAEGMLFTNAFVTNSICVPSRAAVLTGQYGHLTGVMTNQDPLHPDTETFPRLLRDGGYRTALFGKWHLRTEPVGFDRHEVLVGQGPFYNPILITGADSVRHTGYTTDIITGRALEWLDGIRDDDRPFLLMLHYNAAHRYWDPGPEQLALFRDTVLPEPPTFWDDGEGRASGFRQQEMEIGRDLFDRDLKLEQPANLTPDQLRLWASWYDPENQRLEALGLAGDDLVRWKYQRYIADYMRVVLGMDAAIGRILDYLDTAGLADNTVVVYTSDQGFFLGDRGWFDKRWMYEESLRTPLIVRWPGVVEPRSVNTDLVMNLDFAHTFLDLAGLPPADGMQGASLIPLFRGETPADWRDAIYYQYFAYPDWHMVQRQYGVRTHRHKLIHYYEVGEWELFDLALDPNELRSVYDDPRYAGVRDELKRRLDQLRAGYRVPGEDPVPHTPFDPPPELRRPMDGHRH
jgi:arylsulfatase A-like enzyme